jgi:predicted DNA-binding protein (MmcQ/YjbR family)
MDGEEFRDVCLNLPGATETYPFGPETPVYKAANGKVFAITTARGEPSPSVTLKSDPEDGIALREQFSAVIPGYHMNKRHWITVALDGDVPADLLAELATESHRLVAPRARAIGAGARRPG